MGRYSGKTCRLLTMLSMTASFFLVEIIVGYVTNSIALVADSFHMLSDVVSLIVGFAAVRISKWTTERNTYGWVRAEVLGALINAVFLIALCFSILVEALKRLVDVEKIDDPKLMLIVGGVGLLVNLIGLVLFHDHGHSHGGGGGRHGHSHGKSKQREEESLVKKDGDSTPNGDAVEPGVPHNSHISNMSIVSIENGNAGPSSAQLNMRGVFLHVLGDALGSVVVVVSGLVIWFVEAEWKYYVDPAMSVVMVIIILFTTIPLLKESGYILLQAVPDHIQLEEIEKKIRKIDGVTEMHEFHVWQLSGNKLIASVHISMHTDNVEEFEVMAQKVKTLLHTVGIHSCTIQPEFGEVNQENIRSCRLECGPEKTCHPDTCCSQKPKKKKNSSSSSREGVQMSSLSNAPEVEPTSHGTV
ncbi:proton-coupled zinc antiporter SLC30A1-like [Ylistrum balloti]|uniref:proton-coupled zinc antiporter SLC30A1-like n=1 Tax=Ylistrum balloti TaxID=509963 RepID=UPI002905B142|nr:proton-coupled zinc antiporter SLC30A1-like [Ylistrum balloti]